MSESNAKRVIVFGVTGHLGQELLTVLERASFKVESIEGVVSDGSSEAEFEFRGEVFDAHTQWPSLRAGDLVFVCTPKRTAPDVVRAALRAEARCFDCSGAFAAQPEVFVPSGRADEAEDQMTAKAPLVCLPAPTWLAWRPVVDALEDEPGLSRITGTVLCGASARGRDGLIALSEESIAVFNQGETPDAGPAGQPVAFDVVPQALEDDALHAESKRVFGEDLRVDITSVQVPAFVGEGSALSIELAKPMAQSALWRLLETSDELSLVEDGPGSRGLVAVDAPAPGDAEASTGPFGPTLRDAIGRSDVMAGRLTPDRSMPEGQGYRLWLTYDPARLMAETAVRLAGLRPTES